ncbi:High mobility group nucleosome-binding domain-containing protein 5, partial [Ophiophagus hannah]
MVISRSGILPVQAGSAGKGGPGWVADLQSLWEMSIKVRQGDLGAEQLPGHLVPPPHPRPSRKPYTISDRGQSRRRRRRRRISTTITTTAPSFGGGGGGGTVMVVEEEEEDEKEKERGKEKWQRRKGGKKGVREGGREEGEEEEDEKKCGKEKWWQRSNGDGSRGGRNGGREERKEGRRGGGRGRGEEMGEGEMMAEKKEGRWQRGGRGEEMVMEEEDEKEKEKGKERNGGREEGRREGGREVEEEKKEDCGVLGGGGGGGSGGKRRRSGGREREKEKKEEAKKEEEMIFTTLLTAIMEPSNPSLLRVSQVPLKNRSHLGFSLFHQAQLPMLEQQQKGGFRFRIRWGPAASLLSNPRPALLSGSCRAETQGWWKVTHHQPSRASLSVKFNFSQPPDWQDGDFRSSAWLEKEKKKKKKRLASNRSSSLHLVGSGQLEARLGPPTGVLQARDGGLDTPCDDPKGRGTKATLSDNQ